MGAPYPVFLALGGALLAFVPGAPSFTLLPELALSLFVAPVLLDAAYDASLRDLKDNWAPALNHARDNARIHGDYGQNSPISIYGIYGILALMKRPRTIPWMIDHTKEPAPKERFISRQIGR